MRAFSIKTLMTVVIAAIPMLSMAAEAPANESSSFNPMLIALVSLMIILLFAIVALGTAVRQLANVYRDKIRKQRATGVGGKTAPLILLLTLTSLPAMAQEAVEETVVKSSPYISGIPKADFYLLAGMLVLELIVVFALLFTIGTLVRLISDKPAKVKAPKKKRKPFWDRFNKAVAVEEEEDIMLEHDYDGIKELDNSLPPWWKWGFVLTVIIGFVYMWYYHGGGNGPSSREEYLAQVEEGERQKAAYLAEASNNVDENTVTMLDESGIAGGKTLYEMNCAACHAKDGGGGVGPNLTDAYWLHGGSLSDVFKSIKYGWTDKGMKSWKDDFSPKQIAELSSFVKSLGGTTPAAPKEPQGEKFEQQAEAPTNEADSTNSETNVQEENKELAENN